MLELVSITLLLTAMLGLGFAGEKNSRTNSETSHSIKRNISIASASLEEFPAERLPQLHRTPAPHASLMRISARSHSTRIS